MPGKDDQIAMAIEVAIDVANLTLSLANFGLVTAVCISFAKETRIIHFNFSTLRASWSATCYVISACMAVESGYRLLLHYHHHQQQIVRSSAGATRRLDADSVTTAFPSGDNAASGIKVIPAICFSASAQIRVMFIMMAVERSIATFFSADYETNRAYRAIGPVLVVLTCVMALPLGFADAYAWINRTLIAVIALTMDAVVFAAIYVIGWFNQRLRRVISQRLSQRYQILENIHALRRLHAMFLFEALFQSASVLCIIFSRVIHKYRQRGHDSSTDSEDHAHSTYVTMMILNSYVTIASITILYFYFKKHNTARRRALRWLMCGRARVVHSSVVEEKAVAAGNVQKANEYFNEHEYHFHVLQSSWSKVETAKTMEPILNRLWVSRQLTPQ